MTSCVVLCCAAVPLSLIMLSNSNRRPRWCESKDVGGWFSKKSELFNRTLLIMLPRRSFPEEAGAFPEGHFHLDWKHTSITHTHTRTHNAGIGCHKLDVGPLSFVLGADGYIISLLESDMEHVFVYLCLDSISIYHLSVEKLSVDYSVNMFDRFPLSLHVFISLILVFLRLLINVLFIYWNIWQYCFDNLINSLS